MKKSMYLAWLKFLIPIFCVQLLSCSSSDDDSPHSAFNDLRGSTPTKPAGIDKSVGTPPELEKQTPSPKRYDETVQVYSPQYDLPFKAIFSLDDPEGRDRLIDLMNAIFGNGDGEDDFKVRDVIPLHDVPPTMESSPFFFDIRFRAVLANHPLDEKRAKDVKQDDEYYMDIEMQKKRQGWYLKRISRYDSRAQDLVNCSNTSTKNGVGKPEKRKQKTQKAQGVKDVEGNKNSAEIKELKIRSISFLAENFDNNLPMLFFTQPAIVTGKSHNGSVEGPHFVKAAHDELLDYYIQLPKVDETTVENIDELFYTKNPKMLKDWLTFLSIGAERATSKCSIDRSQFQNKYVQSAIDKLVEFSVNKGNVEYMITVSKKEDDLEGVMNTREQIGFDKGERASVINTIKMSMREFNCEFNTAKDMAKKYYPDQSAFIDSLVLDDMGEIISQQGDAQDSVREEDTMKRKHSSDPQVQQSSGADPDSPQRKRSKKGSSENQKVDEIENTKESSKKSKKNSKKIQESTANTKQPIEEDEGDGSTQRKRKKGSKK